MINEEMLRMVIGPLPFLNQSIQSLNLIRSIKNVNNHIELNIATPGLNELAQELFKIQIKSELKKSIPTEHVEIITSKANPKEVNQISRVIAVMSGKGGVGKSLVSGLIAISLKKLGHRVGLMDADITGPSLPMMFNVHERSIGCDEGFLPALTESGIPIMSINLVLEDENSAVMWRGGLIARAIVQFWEQVYWGKLDYLIVDLPPGTADVPLTVLGSLPNSGVIMVFTPQELTAMVVKKAIDMVRQMDRSIIGVVENMSYLFIPEIDKKIEIFGPSRGQEMAAIAGAPLLAQLPIDPVLTALCDKGKIEQYQSEILSRLGSALNEQLQGVS